APRSLHVPTRSAACLPRANACPFPARSGCAAFRRTPPSSLSEFAQLLLQHDFALFIQHAIPARTIAQVQTDRQLRLGKIPALLRRYGANLLHSRSPLSLGLQARR